jgi:ABC-2 type transport system permease protein
MMILARREVAAYFLSPMAYVVAALFLAMVSLVFLWGLRVPFLGIELEPVFRGGAESTLRPLFDVLAYAMVVVLPLLTMRLMAEEFRGGTIETLMTAPVTDGQVILGKFLGAFFLYLVLLVLTLAFLLLVVAFGRPDYGVAAVGYLGMILLGAVYVAVGLFASTLSRHQLVAGLIAIAILTFFTVGIYLLGQAVTLTDAPVETKQKVVAAISRANLIHYFSDFSKGVLDIRGLVLLPSLTAFFLFLSVKVLESRRWR